ncbi:D-alanyl-D-alanine carboxypeptidase [Aneurinibacillus sp. BA2021]|nr:D-alanyl-D-alanine carboxypeptidase [Aneurinibacillus sp. BA2021]
MSGAFIRQSQLTAVSACLIEAEDGRVLWEKQAVQPLPPASMTKMMTTLVVMERVRHGQLHLTDRVRISRQAAAVRGSSMGLKAGETATIRALLYGLLLASGNDAAAALAEYTAGSSRSFVELMNEQARVLELVDTQFRNPHGLSVSGHVSSAYDMCLIARRLVQHTAALSIAKRKRAVIRLGRSGRSVTLRNTNTLLGASGGVDGLKTGYTPKAKYCLCATAPHDRFGRLIAVVMGCASRKARNREAGLLLAYANAVEEADESITFT